MKIILKQPRGLSLIELLVAMTITMILLGGIYQVFISSTNAYSRNESLSRVQENGRFAMHVIREAVVGAGFLGCSQEPANYTSILSDEDDYHINYAVPIQGLEWVPDNPGTADELIDGAWEDDGGVVDPATIDEFNLTDPLTGSDILTVRHVITGQAFDLSADMGGPSANISTEDDLGLQDDQLMLIADCEASTLFRVDHYDDATGVVNPDGDLSKAYAEGAQLYLPRTSSFYIRTNSAGEPALYRRVTDAADPEELVEGVENMQVRYGVDTDGDRAADDYDAANDVSDWTDVVSVRIGLLLRSPNDMTHAEFNNSTYRVDDTDIDAPGDDRRFRMVMSTTIGLRNRLR
ncbi:type IV pilus assembly protein PilW [Desulfuromusa kysingii]|uniref:Type IV pilus assembly protein PilW n=1 Tax=Desulfuromusa kysingii TaxID=37625 RepID=A0A1H4EAH8_9BACT|nr:PilW family protein [Desulfuromusa kysingii]SEA81600.1 type IV pilus assembly protein PilW [Desulfuromusa kysingii]